MLKAKIRRSIRKKRKQIKNTVFCVFMLTCILFIYSNRVFPALSAACISYLNNDINSIMNECILSYFDSAQMYEYIKITYSEDGKVSSVSADTNAVNITRAAIAKLMLSKLKSGDISTVKIPVGCLFGNELAYAKGPRFTFKCQSSNSFLSKVDSEFESRGINQTLHSLYLVFSVTITVSFPNKNVAVPVECRYPLSEILIVGDVPEAYTEIHRQFDDITESEIDDINDFGAQALN